MVNMQCSIPGAFPASDPAQEIDSNGCIGGDRRINRRYGIRLDVGWKLIHRQRVLETGSGYTIDLSSRGILFDAERPLRSGLDVELHISWPALLHDAVALQFVVFGRIVRAEGNRAAIRTLSCEFRTARVPRESCNRTETADQLRGPSGPEKTVSGESEGEVQGGPRAGSANGRMRADVHLVPVASAPEHQFGGSEAASTHRPSRQTRGARPGDRDRH